jgi:CMP-N-acetylneuraminic acid synthetase/spore coat polysaccharide biosynthesis predicted glycosyltransferase SpsG
MQSNFLVIIPARGGSKGIPRKNLRPLNGIPLISYSINLALQSVYKPDVFVSTDDTEIAYFAEKFGANVHMRDKNLGGDKITLDPVIYEAYSTIAQQLSKKYDFVITLQPTSPLLTTKSLDAAIEQMIQSPDIETTLSAVNDTHLTWGKNETGFFPNFAARVNRQQLPAVYKETGGFFISRTSVVGPTSRIGKKVNLFVVPTHEAIDIDSFEDWALCEYFLNRKIIVFSVSGYQEIGLGHVYNCLTLANQILDHRVIFLVDSKSELAYSKIAESNYEVYRQKTASLEDDVIALKPFLVVNDRLDTSKESIQKLKAHNIQIVNIEDLGHGAQYADLVINAIYPEKEALPKHYFGPDYFCAREEFLLHKEKEIEPAVKSVLLSFGGVDPCNLTLKVLQAIHEFCSQEKIKIKVVLGLGFKNIESLKPFSDLEIHRNVQSISDFMYEADIAFSSAGRTIYELALIGTPSIVLAQNEREMSHFFASEENGFIHLGLGKDVSTNKILSAFKELYSSLATRKEMNQKMKKHNIRTGRERVIKLIKDLIEN